MLDYNASERATIALGLSSENYNGDKAEAI